MVQSLFGEEGKGEGLCCVVLTSSNQKKHQFFDAFAKDNAVKMLQNQTIAENMPKNEGIWTIYLGNCKKIM